MTLTLKRRRILFNFSHYTIGWILSNQIIFHSHLKCRIQNSSNIVDATIIKYDRDFDYNDSPYILISDSRDDVYIILYKEQGRYRVHMEYTESVENIESMANIMEGKIDEESSILKTLQLLKFNNEKYNC